MQIEDYFNFLAEDDIRIKGTRIGIESVLDEYINYKQTAETIAERFHTVTLEQVYATILYYLQNKEKVGAYLEDYLEYCRKAREEQEKNPSPGVIRLRELIAERRKTSDNSRPDISKNSSESTTPSPSKYERE
ncbi:MAG: DUF433 domain-containing protein [Candidatus Poribacteria bacterium]|nr:DUF433 domain-containing protein [Candidatus Poribacteria bacterium]